MVESTPGVFYQNVTEHFLRKHFLVTESAASGGIGLSKLKGWGNSLSMGGMHREGNKQAGKVIEGEKEGGEVREGERGSRKDHGGITVGWEGVSTRD